jgi:hypothetical protein
VVAEASAGVSRRRAGQAQRAAGCVNRSYSGVSLQVGHLEGSDTMSDHVQVQKPLWVEALEGMLVIWIIEAASATVTALIVAAYRV